MTNPFYVSHGSSVPATIAAVEAVLNDVDFFFARDALITYATTDIIIRTTPFYPPGSNLLTPFMDEWNANQTGIVRDVAHLLTDLGGPGGVAKTGVVCDIPEAYGWSSGGAEVMGHEIGHNWNLFHCQEWSPCNTTCDSCLALGPKTRDTVARFRDGVACLDEVAGHADPMPPFAYPDAVDPTRDEIAAGTPIAVDVLLNDTDGNLDPLSIAAFDATSEEGATISLSPGTGAGGNDELVYTPPAGVFRGNDHFRYTVGDGTGLETEGDAEVRIAAPSLIGYWKFDGNRDDSSGGGRTAFFAGGTGYTAGVYGQAAQFDGVDDQASAPGFNRNLPEVTLATWVRRSGSQSPFTTLIDSNGFNTEAVLSLGNANELRYRWNGDPATSGWDSGLVVPDLQWVLVALAVEPQQATIYLHDGTTLQSAVNPIAHDLVDFIGTTFLATSPEDGSPHFRGALDDIRIYDHALGAAEITLLHDLGGKSHAPEPPDGGRMLTGHRELSWSPGLGATSHDVYFGTDYEAIRDATPASPEFLGNTTATELLAPPPLLPGGTYAWRVDDVTAGGVVEGDVWIFANAPPIAHWPLDEVAGTTAVDVAGGFDGTFLGSPLVGQTPARPDLGGSVELDGVDDSIEIPPLLLDRNEVTITAWVRRDGVQTESAGVFVARSASTVAGLRMRSNGAPEHRWNDTGEVFWDVWFSGGPGLLDGVWSLVAFVIAPDKRILYVGFNTSLFEVTVDDGNGREEFDGPFYIGQDPIGGRFFRGGVDDVRIYDHALTRPQVESLFAAGIAQGRVPDGAGVPGDQLLLDKLPGEELLLTWSPSCLGISPDYAVYDGQIGDFDGHLPGACSTANATSATIMPQPGNRYFLVVPMSGNREGGYGTDSSAVSRPASVAPCRVQFEQECD